MNTEPMIGTCKLCLAPNVVLRRSHIVPAWAYKRVRMPTQRNPNPVRVHKDRIKQTSQQVWAYLLCDACEQRFSDYERYVSSITYQPDGVAPFRSLVEVTDAVERQGFRTARSIGADMDRLRYFGLSVLWRAHLSAETNLCDLGAQYGEIVRRHLVEGTHLGDSVVTLISFYESPDFDLTSPFP